VALLVGKRLQTSGDRERFVQRTQLRECLDEVEGDREHAGFVDLLALCVFPHRAQALDCSLGLVSQHRSDGGRSQALQLVPPRPDRRRGPGRFRRPSFDFAGATRARRQQGPAALVHRPELQLAVSRLRPFVQQARRCLPIPDPQLELAQVQARQRIRHWLAPLVGQRQQSRQLRSRLAHLAPPNEPLARDPLSGCRNVFGCIRRRPSAPA
jgi:hypothetical protein